MNADVLHDRQRVPVSGCDVQAVFLRAIQGNRDTIGANRAADLADDALADRVDAAEATEAPRHHVLVEQLPFRVPPSGARFFLVANAVERDPAARDAIAGAPNVEITEGRNGEGFYEAVVRSLAEAR